MKTIRISRKNKRKISRSRNKRKISKRRNAKRKSPSRKHVVWRQIDEIYPSPENDKLYKPVLASDPAIISLSKSIATEGMLDPIVIDCDGYIISGHRRFKAAQLAGLANVPVILRQDVSRTREPDRFVLLLRKFNMQRVKSFDEQVREEALSTDPAEAHRVLVEHRRQKADLSYFDRMSLGNAIPRKQISAAKEQMVQAVLKILEQSRDYWGVSVRKIHYKLLNNPPLKHASKPDSAYKNDLASYKDLTNLLTRLRLEGRIPMDAIADDTRVSEAWNFFRESSNFVKRELDSFCKNYYRDLQQSQPNHIEIFCEKLTLESTVRPIAGEYCIPLTIGKGMCSLPPRYSIYQRYKKSGREKLIVLLLSDFDPDGVVIAQSFARSMRDDFDVKNIVAVRVALTPEQIKEHQLPNAIEAKSSSVNYQKFVDEYGTECHELDALDESVLQQILREAIDGVLDVTAYNHEIDQEKAEAANLDAYRKVVARTLSEVRL